VYCSQGQTLKYDGEMKAEDIVMFGVSAYQQVRANMQQKQETEAAAAKPVSELRELKTTVQALRFIDINDVSVIGFFDPSDEAAQAGFKTFVAKSSQSGVAHGMITSELPRKDFKVKETPKVIMFKTMGEKPVAFKGNCSDPNKLAAWAQLNGNIPVRHLDAQKIQDISSSTTPVVLYFHGNATKGVKGKEMLRELADEFTDVLVFYMADYGSFGGLAQQVGLHTTEDSVVILYPPKGHHFKMPQKATLTSDTMREFFNDYLADRVQRTLRSQPAPVEPWAHGKVQVAVTTTLLDIIKDDKQDVLLELCKPSMEDCATLGGVMDSTAKAVEHVKTFKVVRVDVESNEVSALFEIPHVPLLLFFPAQNKTGVSYNGAATEAKILEYVASQASTPFEVPTAVKEAEQMEKAQAQAQKVAPTPEEVAKVEAQAAEQVSAMLHKMKTDL